MKEKKERLNTQLESAGAEHLVLGNLLRYGIQAFITSKNFESYDIVAFNPKNNKGIKIQVKSRWATNSSSFYINKFDSDFVIFVKLNCGKSIKQTKIYTYEDPEYYIIKTSLCKKYRKKIGQSKLILKRKKEELYLKEKILEKNQWNLIKEYLE